MALVVACPELTSGHVERIARLRAGIDVPEFGALIPWHSTRSELVKLIPEEKFNFSVCGWPQLEFTLLGFKANFGFNFISDPESRLTEVQLFNIHPRKLKRTFRTSARKFEEALGSPNWMKSSRGQYSWHWDALRLSTHLTKFMTAPGARRTAVHILSVYNGF
jgi:hypothetical protein